MVTDNPRSLAILPARGIEDPGPDCHVGSADDAGADDIHECSTGCHVPEAAALVSISLGREDKGDDAGEAFSCPATTTEANPLPVA